MLVLAERDLLIRQWDGRAVLFDCGSGDTLFLDPVQTVVLDVLRRAPTTVAALIATLQSEFDDAPAELAQAAHRAIEELDKLGLLRPDRTHA